MLAIAPTNDKECLDSLWREIFGVAFLGDVGYVLTYRDVPIGAARLVVTPKASHLVALGVVQGERKKGYGDFFTRALMNNLTMVSEVLYIDYLDDYFVKFGFLKDGERMKIASADIVFPSQCGGHNDKK